MATATNGVQRKTVKELKEERQRLLYESEIARLTRQRDAHRMFVPTSPFGKPTVSRQIHEEWAGTWVDAYLDMVGEWTGGTLFGGHGTPVSTTIDRRIGQDFPIFVNEVQLGIYRAPARILCQSNGYAIGLLNGLCNYIAGTGMVYTVVPRSTAKREMERAKKGNDIDDPLVKDCQDILDEFQSRELWWELERELIWRTHEDGEYFLRMGHVDGDTWVRTIEPEQILFDARMFAEAEARGIQDVAHEPQAGSFGILTDYEDTQTVKGYWKRRLTGASQDKPDGEFIEARDIVHHKVNTKRSIKRGLTDFCFSTSDALSIANKLRRNLGMGAAVQAALAGVIEQETATAGQVNAYMDAAAPPNSTPNRDTGIRDHLKLDPGEFAYMPSFMKFVPPPGATSGEAHVLILGACLRQVTARYNAPDWLATSDSSTTNFAAALTAESPWVMSILCHQKVHKERNMRVMRRVLTDAARRSRLPKDVLDRVDVSVGAPSAMARNTLQEAQENQIYVQLGAKSIQSVCEEQDLDYEEEPINIEEHRDRTGGMGELMELPEEGGIIPAKTPKGAAGTGTAPKPGSNPPGSAQESRLARVEDGLTKLMEAWNEQDHPRADNGKFGSGGSSKKKPLLHQKGRDKQADIHDRGPAIAEMHGRNMRSLVAKMAHGEYAPEDVIEDSKIYADKAIRGNNATWVKKLRNLRSQAIEHFGADAVVSEEWANVEKEFRAARNKSESLIETMREEVEALAQQKSRATPASLHEMNALNDKLTDSYYQAFSGPIGDALDAFKAKWKASAKTQESLNLFERFIRAGSGDA